MRPRVSAIGRCRIPNGMPRSSRVLSAPWNLNVANNAGRATKSAWAIGRRIDLATNSRTYLNEKEWSGRVDLNRRPPGPEVGGRESDNAEGQ